MSIKIRAEKVRDLCILDRTYQTRRIGDVCSVKGNPNNLTISNIPQGYSDKIRRVILSNWPLASVVDKSMVGGGTVELSVTYRGDDYGYTSSSQTPKNVEVLAPVVSQKTVATSIREDMKVAIVGVEGSGKTVMLAGLGALYSQPNADGVFISPKNFKTLTYVDRLMSMLKSGQWPAATAEDVMQGLDWVVRQRADNARPVQLGEISLLDFAGEVYRAAFVQDEGENKAVENEIARLQKYLAEADCILVLVNLSDVIANGPFNARVEESVWITNAILDYVLPETRSDGKKLPRAAIVLSQADSYASTIEECGGPKQTLQRYLPHVANNYGWLDTFAVCTVDKTVLDEEGRPVPAPNFSPKGLAPIMEWVLKK